MVKVGKLGSLKRISLKSLRPIFPISRILGILPYKSFKISQFWIIYSILINTIIILYVSYYKAYYVFFSDFSYIQTLSTKIIFIAWSLIELFIVTSHLLTIIFSSKKFDIFLRSINKLSTKCVKQEFKFINFLTYTFIIYTFPFTTFGLIFVPRWDTFARKSIVFSAQLTYCLVFLIITNFCTFCHILINQIDDLIQNLGEKNARVFLFKYKILLRLSHLLIDIFSMQLVAICVLASVALPLAIHFDISRIREYITKGDTTDLVSVIGVTVQFNWDLTLIFFLCTTCSKAKTKSMEFNYKLFKVMKKNQYLCSDTFLYSYMTSWEIMTFKPYGLIELENSYLTSLIGSTTTYLMLLIQYSH